MNGDRSNFRQQGQGGYGNGAPNGQRNGNAGAPMNAANAGAPMNAMNAAPPAAAPPVGDSHGGGSHDDGDGNA
jgi:hypothetical protein